MSADANAEDRSRGVRDLRLLVLVFVLPAAGTVLSQLEDHLELTAWLRRIVQDWEALSHSAWMAFFDWLRPWMIIDLEANQLNGLTLSALYCGAAASSLLLQRFRLQTQQTVPPWWYWLFYCALTVLVALPTALVFWPTLGPELLSMLIVAGPLMAFLFWIGYLTKTARAIPGHRGGFPSDDDSFAESIAVVARAPFLAIALFVPAIIFAVPASAFGGPILTAESEAGTLAEICILPMIFLFSSLFLTATSWQTIPRLVAVVVGVLVVDKAILIAAAFVQ